SDWGGRSELEIDRKARIWARVSRKQKISILVLSSAMGLNLREILENVCYPEFFLSFLNDKERKKIGSKENSILEFYQQFACVGGDPVFSESLCKELQKKFFQQRCELGRIGRRNMNRKLNLDIPQNNTFLLPRDILAAADHLIGLKFGMGALDDMNHLKNKRIRSVADLLQDQFGLALVRLENVVRGLIRCANTSRPEEARLRLPDPGHNLLPGGLVRALGKGVTALVGRAGLLYYMRLPYYAKKDLLLVRQYDLDLPFPRLPRLLESTERPALQRVAEPSARVDVIPLERSERVFWLPQGRVKLSLL
ncbi:DNA-directed RNA polymerase subunit beta-like, partial [Solanum dulcamara]|uniref:DNA-directed RNA polymerase subunit beta-like n=1 Tax=Solanum dulcamara TaxID=45834 RepID=UPI0024869CF6